ncbi:MAG: B12-binding domain-containing radical SAM protein [Nanobdellota archaeon]
MRIKLINMLRLYRYTFPPYGLGVINKKLKEKKIDSEIFDLDIVIKYYNSIKNNNSIDIKYIKDNLWDLPKILLGKKTDEYLDEQAEKIISVLNVRNNEILAFHVPHKEFYFSLYIAKKIKEFKSCPIVFGGLEIQRKNREQLSNLIEDLGIDYVNHFVIEGTFKFFEELTSNKIDLLPKYPNIAKNEEVEQIDWILPDFNKEHLDLYKIRPEKLKYYFFEINRSVYERFKEMKGKKTPLVIPYKFQFGCYNKCAYCGFGKFPIKKPVDEVIEDIDHMKKKYNTNNFYFINTNIAVKKKYTNELLSRLQKEHEIKWSDTANVSMANPEIIKEFRKSGCIELFMGLGTASEKLQNYVYGMNSFNRNNHISKCFKSADENGIWLVTDFITGLPYERNSDIIKTSKFLMDNRRYINGVLTNGFIMMKSSPFAQNPKKYGLKLHKKEYSVDDITSDRDITISNFGGINFDEIHGLSWEQKKIQQSNSSVYFSKFIKKNYPKQVYSWYPIFLLYNNFDSKREIQKFLHN